MPEHVISNEKCSYQYIYPCEGCIYYKLCGDFTRMEPCTHRTVNNEQNQEVKKS